MGGDRKEKSEVADRLCLERGQHLFIVQLPTGMLGGQLGCGLTKRPARPGAAGQTVASDPLALAGNVGSDPGKVRKALYEPEFQSPKALGHPGPHLSVT